MAKHDERKTFRQQTTEIVTVMLRHITQLEMIAYESSRWTRLKRLWKGVPVPHRPSK